MIRYGVTPLILSIVVISIVMVGLTNAGAVTKSKFVSNGLCKIYIDEDGIYRIGYLGLIDAGFNLRQINPGIFQLINQGREMPIYLSDETTEKFGKGDFIEFYGTLNKKDKAQGTVVVTTEKVNIVTGKNIKLNNRYTFTIPIQIPARYTQVPLVAYYYLWSEKANWDAAGFTAVPVVLSDSTKRETTIALPPYLSHLLWGAIPNGTGKDEGSKPNEFAAEKADKNAQILFETGETYYQQKDLLNAFLKYSEAFQTGNRNPNLIQKLKKMVVPVETFEKVTAVQVELYKSSKPPQISEHKLTNEIAHSGKKSEVFEITYPVPCWYDFWGKDVDIPLAGPLGGRLYARSTVPDTQLALFVMVSFGTSHRVMFCAALTRLELNQWQELKIDDIYQIAKKRALSQNDNVGEIKTYPELLVSHYTVDAETQWDYQQMRIRKIGFSTGGKPGQFSIDDLELFFPRNKLEYYP